MKELEYKIREALPRLKEIGVGLKFIDKLGFKAEIVYENLGTYYYFSESDNEVFSVSSNFFDGICKEVIGHPIKLNDVLEWHSKDNRDRYSHFEVVEGKAYFVIYDKENSDMLIWDLSSVFLDDQSSELKEFLNSL